MKHLYFLIFLILTIGMTGCAGKQAEEAQPDGSFKTAGATEILAAGATFPYPLYARMFDEYNRQFGVQVNYQAIGSGGGIRQLTSKTIDFGATDAFMKDEELKNAPGKIVHLPVCLGAVVITYNLPGNPKLNFTPEVLSGIFTGDIERWNDPRIKAVNPGINLPNLHVLTVHRSDGSGTTHIFTDYLSKASPDWKKRVGTGKSVRWLSGLGAKGNPGVAGFISQTPGSIGYVELLYAAENKLTMAAIRNQAGNIIMPSLEASSVAADVDLPADTRISLTNSEAPQGYPMTSFTWLILYEDLSTTGMSEARARHVAKLLWWMTHDGQKLVSEMNYSPLSEAAVEKCEAILKNLHYKGRKLLEAKGKTAA